MCVMKNEPEFQEYDYIVINCFLYKGILLLYDINSKSFLWKAYKAITTLQILFSWPIIVSKFGTYLFMGNNGRFFFPLGEQFLLSLSYVKRACDMHTFVCLCE